LNPNRIEESIFRLFNTAEATYCPTVFFRSPQLWRMNVAIRHINIQFLKKIYFFHLLMRLSTNKIKLPQPIITKVANFYIIKAKSKLLFMILSESGFRKGPIRHI